MTIPFLTRTLLFTLLLLVTPSCRHTSGRPEPVVLIDDEATATALVTLETSYDAATDSVARARIRDQFARRFVALVDMRFNEFLDDLVRQRKAFDASADLTSIGLDTASVLFTPASTKSILAGLSGLATASKTSINKAYFYEQTLPVIISQMTAERAAVLADIHTGLSRTDDVYPLHRLTTDLQRYFSAGTIDGAIEQIQQGASETAREAEAAMIAIAEGQVANAESLRVAALDSLRDQEAFDGLKLRLREWWETLDDDTRAEQSAVIRDNAVALAVVTTAFEDKSNPPAADPEKFGAFLDTLEFATQSHRLLLAAIAQHADPTVVNENP